MSVFETVCRSREGKDLEESDKVKISSTADWWCIHVETVWSHRGRFWQVHHQSSQRRRTDVMYCPAARPWSVLSFILVVFRLYELICRTNEIIFCRNEIVIRTNKIVLVFRLYEILIRTNEIRFRTNEIIFFSFNVPCGPPYLRLFANRPNELPISICVAEINFVIHFARLLRFNNRFRFASSSLSLSPLWTLNVHYRAALLFEA